MATPALLSRGPTALSTAPCATRRAVSSVSSRHHSIIAQVKSGQPFNEGATQVRRLIIRDKKEFLGNKGDILEKFETEFGEGTDAAAQRQAGNNNPFVASPSTSSSDSVASASTASTAAANGSASGSSSSSNTGASTSGRPLSVDNPFKPSGAAAAGANPFGPSTAAPKPFKQSIEPLGLNPEMSPDPLVKETPVEFLKSITLTQVVIASSFTLIILLMLATFQVAVNAGAIRINGL